MKRERGGPTTVMTRVVSRLLLLPALIVAAAVLVKGYAQPGDGFSAGVIAGLGVMLQYLAFGCDRAEKLPGVGNAGKISLFGLLVMLGVAGFPLLIGDPVLMHYPPPGSGAVYVGTLELITAVLFDLGIFLLVYGFVTAGIGFIARTIAGEEEYAGARAEVPAGDEENGAAADEGAGERA